MYLFTRSKTLPLFIGLLIIFPQSWLSAQPLSSDQVLKLKSEIAANRNPQKTIEMRVRLARHFFDSGQASETISYLRPVAEKLHTGGMRLLATAYSKTNQPLQAIRVLQFLTSQNKRDYRSLTRLAKAYMENRQYPKAVESSNTAIKINNRYRPAFDVLAQTLEKMNKRYDLKETLLDMLRLFGGQSELLSKVCRIYYEDGFLKEAFTFCKAAISKDHSVPENHVFLSLTYKSVGKDKTALRIAQSAARQFKKSEFAQFTAGELNRESNNNAKAYRFFKTGTEADPTSFRNWFGRAQTSFDTLNYADALVSFKRSCRLKKDKTTQEFRSAAGKLKKINPNSSWTKRFKAAALKCRYQAN